MARFDAALQQVKAAGLRPEWVHAGNSSTVDAGTPLQSLRGLAEGVGARVMARPGLALYGYSLPLESVKTAAGPLLDAEYSPHDDRIASAAAGETAWVGGRVRQALQPVLSWKTRIVSLREVAAGDTIGYGAAYIAARPMRLALLPVGYADGLRRELSGSNTSAEGRPATRPGGEVLLCGQRAPMVGRISMDLTMVDVTAIPAAAIGDEAVLIGEQDGQQHLGAEDHARIAGTIPYEILCGISDRVPRVVV